MRYDGHVHDQTFGNEEGGDLCIKVMQRQFAGKRSVCIQKVQVNILDLQYTAPDSPMREEERKGNEINLDIIYYGGIGGC